ncbi:V-set and transmembrane domain-containing protein 2-like protein [Chanos chanos]|uniref:V-set and transmembrane domain-containing protein 2-like protein n=1 Tax=Chanos chanos TaxID=29144 RepID=A0A6J2VPP9_CHACN|nr:V-set and transmembrane domain-containing protein 2-like protein [Chanos chanos]
MGAFGVILGISHYVGLYIQLSAAFQPGANIEVDNHISGNALFTEVPHDIVTQSGQDVEMACSFRGAGSPSVSLEIQWWYIRNHREWAEKPAWTTNQVVPGEERTKDATKISVVKVAGSNISHKLRLSSVKPSDEGTYECRVIDFSDSHAQHHRVHAFLQVQPPGEGIAHLSQDAQLHKGDHQQLHEGDQLHKADQKLGRGNHQLHNEDHQLSEGDRLNYGEQNQHRGDHHLHRGDYQKIHQGEQNPEGNQKLYEEDHHQLHEGDHHQLHEGDHQLHKQTEEHKKRPAHIHQSEDKDLKRLPTEKHTDCTANDCVL